MKTEMKIFGGFAFFLLALMLTVPSAPLAALDETALGVPQSRQTYPLQTFSTSTTVASTTAVTVTALAGRTYLEIAAGDSDSMTNQIWVGVGTTTVAVGVGRLVTQDNPLRLWVDDGVVFSTIASEAVPMAVLQAKY